MKNSTIVLWFMAAFHLISALAESVHALEYLQQRLGVHLQLSPATFEMLCQGVIALLALILCLRLDRWWSIHRLTRADHWKKAESAGSMQGAQAHVKHYANRVAFRLNLSTVAMFALLLPALEFISKIAIIDHSLHTLTELLEPALAMSGRVWLSGAYALLAWACLMISRRVWLARLRDIALPADDEHGLEALLDLNQLRFRSVHLDEKNDRQHTAAAHDIKQLASTEDYGPMGRTDFPQVFAWWRVYPKGNWVAEYRERVVGGIDIWPLTREVYLQMRSGDMGEEGLTAQCLAPHQDTEGGTYWYVGSISLDLRLKNRRYRSAALAKLVETALLQNFMPSVKAYPAHVLALVWTTEGENLAKRAGFAYVGSRKNPKHVAAEPLYELVFSGPEDIVHFVERLQRRLRPLMHAMAQDATPGSPPEAAAPAAQEPAQGRLETVVSRPVGPA
jgi:hypothetical protein